MPAPGDIKTEESEESAEEESPSRFQRWVVQPIVKQLKQGTSPRKLAWTISLGVTLGIFPIMGSTSVVCLIAGYFLKLNQPILHLFKSLTYPIHLAMILVYIRIGQQLNGVPLLKLSIPQLMGQFKDDPAKFAKDFGTAALYGIEAWTISAIVLIPLLYFIALPLLKKLMKKRGQETA
jgi:uncharacterized protein (DUF2062 family)